MSKKYKKARRKKMTLREIRKTKKDIMTALHSALNELETLTTPENDEIWTESSESEWIEENFYENGNVIDTIDVLFNKLIKERKNA